jgi:ATP-dependent DNA helicase DinG
MSLRQGAGRLIRTHDDRGVIAILDSRILKSGWGQKARASLPQSAPVTTDTGDVIAFFAEVDRAA